MSPRTPFLIASLGLALGACATPPDGPPVPTRADQHRIAVTQSGERLDISAPAGALALDAQTKARLSDFASVYLRQGHGALILSAPSGGANADSASRLAQETRMALLESGVSSGAIAGSAYDAAGATDAPIVLSFTRYVAEAPECAPIYRQDLAHQSDNQAYASFGCAMQSNLAAMIEDPHDLLGPRSEDPRDSNRRATVMQAYRAGTQTHASRSGDERVAISDAVQ